MSDFNYQNNGGYYNYSYTPPPKKQKKKRKFGFFKVLLCCVLSAVIGAGSAFCVFTILNKNKTVPQTTNEPVLEQNNVNINVDEEAASVVEAVAKKVTPSVIGIRTTTSVMSFFGDQEASGEGSGVIYRKDGYIITNYHVIADGVTNRADTKIEVFLDTANSKSYPATVVGYNISADLAVIKINAKNLPAIEVTDSSKLKAGQYVITVGNPGGLEFMDSVTYGVISGLDRVVSSDSDVSLIQTDAAINPGNSGGALVNTKGQLVGINSSKIVAEEFEGMGFAVPSNTVVEICDKIIKNENSPEPFLGVTVSERYTSKVLAYYGFPSGAVVLSVTEGSPAYNAGIRRGDIITKFAGKEIKEYSKLEEYLKKCKVGQKVDATIYRNGNYYSTTVLIGSNNLVE
ncbi:MAG: PDZ domain-containing protein [Ruminococcaceae bacterium]|nr:PDZ domain-containing protein [Oscillospiraceae bacterium]